MLKTLQPMGGFQAILWLHDGVEPLHCSGDRVVAGRYPEEMGPAQDDFVALRVGLEADREG